MKNYLISNLYCLIIIVSKGISANLMKKTAKRRRSKIELKEAARKELMEKQLLAEKLQEV